jgi:YHS domain-containing protein
MNLWASSCCSSGKDGDHSSHESGGQPIQTKAEVKSEKAEDVKDPVCGMEVSDIKKAPSEEYKGKVYYFCSEHCKKTWRPIYPRNHHSMVRVKDISINTQI